VRIQSERYAPGTKSGSGVCHNTLRKPNFVPKGVTPGYRVSFCRQRFQYSILLTQSVVASK